MTHRLMQYDPQPRPSPQSGRQGRLQGWGDAQGVVECEIALPAVDLADEGPVEFADVSAHAH